MLRTPWNRIRLFLFKFYFIFTLLFILTLSFPHRHIPDVPGWIAPVFEGIVKWVGDNILQLREPYTEKLISDSTGLYIHLLALLFLAIIGAATWSILDKKRVAYIQLQNWLTVILAYYLAFHLLVYGSNKIFKWQFYLPEPNTLFTTMGNTYRDLLYWSTMGTSRSYSMFLGICEVIAALLLLFRPTRLLGALASFAVLLNIVAVNFSFDISVKIYSCFLLLLSILVAIQYRSPIAYLVSRIPPPAPKGEDDLRHKLTFFSYPVLRILKLIVIAWMFWSVLTPYVRSGNYNDDIAPRPSFHGAYDIPVFVRGKDTLAPLLTDTYRWRRVFIHRRGYLIVQGMNDEMQDYAFEADTITHQWKIRHEGNGNTAKFLYEQMDSATLRLNGIVGNDTLTLWLKKIDLSKLPVMQKEFNWTIE